MRPSCIAVAGLLFLTLSSARAADAALLWRKNVGPLLDEQCVKCHGPLKQKSGLTLDTPEAALKGNEDGPIVKPGVPGESSLLDALQPGADPHMPPKKQLSEAEIAQIRDWVIALGQPPQPKTKATDAAVADFTPAQAIDYFIEEGWRQREVTPAGPCDELAFIRRVYLDLAGRIPQASEIAALQCDSTAQKREALVDRLLASDDYARNFRELWDVILMGRATGKRDQRRADNGWYDFLETAFRQNRPWTDVMHAIILARPEKPEDRGALWFLYERKNDYQQMVEAVAPVIYGTRVSCAQCHDHPLAREIKQGHYWGLVTAFNRSKNLEKGSPAVSESASGGFINFTNLRKESQPAVMTMLTGLTIEEARPADEAKPDDPPENYVDPSAKVKVPKFSRRAALAEAATQQNPLLAKAFVNYTWAILMGRGMVHPVDEINSKHPPSHPELLDWLANDFASHGYDMRRLVRGIALSRVYALAAAPAGAQPDPEAFAAAAEKPLTGEAIARSVQIATGRPELEQALRRSFIDAFPDVLPRVQRATIQQAMLLANNEQLAALFKPAGASAAPDAAAPSDTISHLLILSSPEDRVREAFRRALLREPDASELQDGARYLAEHEGRPGEAVGQLLWALVTGPEFLTNH